MVEPYPAGVQAVGTMVPGTAFFPVGQGTWKDPEIPANPKGGLLFIQHDAGSAADHSTTIVQGSEDLHANGWRNLLELLDQVDVQPTSCFFTSYYLGIRTEAGTGGGSPGAQDAGYTERCGRFLMHTIAVMRPRAVLCLGSYVPGLLGPWSPDLTAWTGVRGLTRLDERAAPMVRSARFPLAGHAANVAALTHPQRHRSDVHRRHYRGTSGHSAEVLMMLDALREE